MWGGCCAKLKKIQFRQGSSDVRAGPVVQSSDVRQGSDIRCLGELWAWDEQRGFVVEMSKFVESGGFRGWKWWGQGEKARSTQNNANPRIKSNKISTHQQITKKLGLFLWGISNLGQNQQKLG